jgi:ribosome-associated protein
MEKIEFSLGEAEFIELNKLLKILQIAQTGGHAKLLIQDGLVMLNKQPESRIRAKLRVGMLLSLTKNLKLQLLVDLDCFITCLQNHNSYLHFLTSYFLLPTSYFLIPNSKL